MFETETVKKQIVGPYRGKPIAGASGNLVEAIIAVEYRFDECTIRVEGIPARIDCETDREYLHGPDALRLNELVNEMVTAVRASNRLHRKPPPYQPNFRINDFAAA